MAIWGSLILRDAEFACYLQSPASPASASRTAPLAFAATSNRLAADAPLSTLTPLTARSQSNPRACFRSGRRLARSRGPGSDWGTAVQLT